MLEVLQQKRCACQTLKTTLFLGNFYLSSKGTAENIGCRDDTDQLVAVEHRHGIETKLQHGLGNLGYRTVQRAGVDVALHRVTDTSLRCIGVINSVVEEFFFGNHTNNSLAFNNGQVVNIKLRHGGKGFVECVLGGNPHDISTHYIFSTEHRYGLL